MKFPISRSSNSWFSMQVISEARGHSKEMPTSRMSGLRSIVTLDPPVRRRRLGYQYHLGSARPPRDVPGDVAECGVFKGSSLAAIALYLRDNRLAKHVFGLDSFQGFDASVEEDIRLA